MAAKKMAVLLIISMMAVLASSDEVAGSSMDPDCYAEC